ncbi:MAG: hypothetical protein ACJ8AW_16845 [Rhodopila sp.]|jgi:hypothetical protein
MQGIHLPASYFDLNETIGRSALSDISGNSVLTAADPQNSISLCNRSVNDVMMQPGIQFDTQP